MSPGGPQDVPFPEARATAAAYLDAVDREAPGLVEGLYLVGSVALGEFRPRTSDVDFVAATARPPDAPGLRALDRAHRRVKRAFPVPHFDGIYVTWEELSRDPGNQGLRRCFGAQDERHGVK